MGNRNLKPSPKKVKELNLSIFKDELLVQRIELLKEYINEDLLRQFLYSYEVRQQYVETFYSMFAKRVFDIFLATLLIVMLSPLLFLTYLLIKINMKTDPIFKQKRIGRNFEIFTIYKFCTLVEVESLKLAEVQQSNVPLQKKSSRLRTTRLGRFLRKWKIDELPQLFNVLQGSMSIVGPRPLTISDTSCCPSHFLGRFNVKPGMTGLWQALLSNNCDGKVKFFLDARYARKCSFLFDIYLIFKTVFIVLEGESEN